MLSERLITVEWLLQPPKPLIRVRAFSNEIHIESVHLLNLRGLLYHEMFPRQSWPRNSISKRRSMTLYRDVKKRYHSKVSQDITLAFQECTFWLMGNNADFQCRPKFVQNDLLKFKVSLDYTLAPFILTLKKIELLSPPKRIDPRPHNVIGWYWASMGEHFQWVSFVKGCSSQWTILRQLIIGINICWSLKLYLL